KILSTSDCIRSKNCETSSRGDDAAAETSRDDSLESRSAINAAIMSTLLTNSLRPISVRLLIAASCEGLDGATSGRLRSVTSFCSMTTPQIIFLQVCGARLDGNELGDIAHQNRAGQYDAAHGWAASTGIANARNEGLAQQAANGSYTSTQRQALDDA